MRSKLEEKWTEKGGENKTVEEEERDKECWVASSSQHPRCLDTPKGRERKRDGREERGDDKTTRHQHQSGSEETRLGNNIKALNKGHQRRRQELEWQQRLRVCVCMLLPSVHTQVRTIVSLWVFACHISAH